MFMGILMLVNYLILSPPRYPLKNVNGSRSSCLFEDYDSNILLLMAETKNDWSYAWVNFWQKEVGFFTIKDISDDLNIDIQANQIICVSRSAVDRAEYLIDVLKDFVSVGGILVIECPSDRWQELTMIEIADNEINCSRITTIDLNMPDIEILKGMPLNTKRLKARIGQNVSILMKMDDEPVICEARFGKGKIVSILFDYSLQSVSMKQGYKVKKKWMRGIDGIKTPDMVMDKSLLNNIYPYADIMDRFLMRVVERETVIPRWWYYPKTYQATLIMSHDEDYFDDKSCPLVEYEAENNIYSTFFLMPDSTISPNLIKRMTDIGVHWNRFKISVDKEGIHQNKLADLKKQLISLKQMSSENRDILSSRIHHLAWDKDYVRCFKVLKDNGIKIDSSYGPLRGNKGYLYGTGFPFYPLDEHGRIIEMFEIPFQVQEQFGGVDNSYLKELIQGAVKYNTTLVTLYHPHYFEGASRKDYLDVISMAREYGLWMTSFGDYLKHWEARIKSKINYVSMEGMLKIEVDVQGDNLTLCVPQYQQRISDVLVDGDIKRYDRIDNNILIEVEYGTHKLEIYYQDGS
ncbi:MAG: hypothetical protein AAB296_04835 [Candidatus Desantisbacteria bacterium]